MNSLAFWHGTDLLSINCWLQVCCGSKFQVRENSTFLSSLKTEKNFARGLQHCSAELSLCSQQDHNKTILDGEGIMETWNQEQKIQTQAHFSPSLGPP